MERRKNLQKVVAALTTVGHGDFAVYNDALYPLGQLDPEMLAHFVAYNHTHTRVRDQQIALPLISLRCTGGFSEIKENAMAHLMLLGPRELYRAYNANRAMPGQRHNRYFKENAKKYLRARETSPGWWARTALSHRKALKGLYAVTHTPPCDFAQAILFEKCYDLDWLTGPLSVFSVVARLKDMSPKEAAGHILNYRIPIPVAIGAVRSIKDRSILLALVEGMTGQQAIKSANLLKRIGALDDPVVKAAYNDALERAQKDKRVSALSADKAAKAVGGKTAKRLQRAKDEHVAQSKMDLCVAVLADRSGSMSNCIEAGKEIAAALAAVFTETHLVFFDDTAKHLDVSSMGHTEIASRTRMVRPGGSTSIGCGLAALYRKGISPDAVVVVSDGHENQSPCYEGVERGAPVFFVEFKDMWGTSEFRKYCERKGHVILPADQFDEYALFDLQQAIGRSVVGILDEVMDTPLLTLDEVFSASK